MREQISSRQLAKIGMIGQGATEAMQRLCDQLNKLNENTLKISIASKSKRRKKPESNHPFKKYM